jgi:hypothetical protein
MITKLIPDEIIYIIIFTLIVAHFTGAYPIDVLLSDIVTAFNNWLANLINPL